MVDPALLEAITSLVNQYGLKACEEALEAVTPPQRATAGGKRNWKLAHQVVIGNLRNNKQAVEIERHQNMQFAMLNASIDSILAIDDKGIIAVVNRACLETFQYSEEEMIGKNISIIVGAEHAAKHDAYLRAYREIGETKLMGTKRELTARRKNGEEFPVMLGLQQVENGMIVGFVRDISDEYARRKLLEENLNEATMKAAVADASFDSMFVVTADGVIQTVNRSAVNTFGYDTAEELVGKNISVCVGGGHAEFHDSYLRRYKETGDSRLINLGTMRELTARRKDGTEFPVKLGIKRVDHKSKDGYLLVGFVRDITDEVERRKLAAIELAQRKLKAAILDASFDSMFAIDSVGKILTVNRAAVETFGYASEGELLGQNVKIIVGGIHAAKHDSYMKRYMETGETRLIGTKRELTARRKDGSEFPVLVGIEVIESDVESNKVLVGYVRDITDEVERRRLAAEQEEQRKMKAAILDASFDSMFAIDSVGKILTVNRAAVETFGYESEGELLGQNVKIIVGGIHAAKHDSYMKRYMETGETRLIGTKRELTARRKDGSEFPVLVGIEVIESDVESDKVLVGYVRDITDEVERRKLAAIELAQRKLKAAILDASFDSMFAIDSVGKILTVNRAAVETFGYASECELLGQNVKIIVGGIHAAKHDSYMKRYMETGETRLIGTKRELTARRKDGSEFPVLVGIEVIESDGESDKVLVGYVRDITDEVERRRLAAEQEEQRKMKAAILDASFDSMFAIDSVGKILTVNRAAVETFGYESEGELLGQNVKIIVGGIHAAKHDSYMKRYMGTGETRLIGTKRELTARRKDGSEFPVLVGIEVIESDGENDKVLVGYVRDITDEVERRKLAAIELAQRKLKAAILDASFDSMFAIDSVGKILTVNRAAVETFGYASEGELLGQNVKIIVGGIHAAKHDSYMKRYMETGETRLIGTKRELTARRKDGSEFPVLVGIEVIESDGEGDKVLVGYVRDITDEVERRRLAAEQEEQRKMKAAILDASFDSMFAIDSVGKILTVNRAAVETFGYESDSELIDKNISIIVGGIHAAKHDSYMKRYMDTGETRLIGTRRELTARRKNGTEFPVVVGISVVNREGRPPLLVGYVRDITEEKRAMQLEIEKRTAEELLHNMLPRQIALRLLDNPNHLADYHMDATILFADIVGFTKLSDRLEPLAVVTLLNDLFTRFDRLVERYALNKVKTIGDCFMVTSVPFGDTRRNGCATVCHFAFDMIQSLLAYNDENPHEPLDLRVGINTGPVVAGVVGQKRFLYDLWGDAVNVASRMESTGVPGRIQVTQAVVETVGENCFVFEARGAIEVKGKGSMETYFLNGRKATRGVGLYHYESTRTLDSSSGSSAWDLMKL